MIRSKRHIACTVALRTPAIRFAAVAAAVLAALSAHAQDANVTVPVAELERMLQSDPMKVVSAKISRPKAKGDITLKAEVAFGERPPMRVKLRKAEPGADDFNNVPRYDLAAYELQKLFIDPAEYVVPPTALRTLPRSELLTWSPKVRATFGGADEVLCVVQYWLHEVDNPTDVLDMGRFGADAAYARHVGQLNVLTYLIHHSDSNQGNFLVSLPPGSRLFSVDNGVAFAAEESDRGTLWQDMRVTRLPADTVQRLRALTAAELTARLGVLAQWELRDGAWVAVTPGANASPRRGVRREGGTLQMGLTTVEIDGVWRRLQRLLARIDDGGITVVASAAPARAPIALASLSGAGTILPARAQDAATSWQDVERVVAFADVHGAYAELARLLQAAAVVDGELHWSGGRTHLVSTGDLLDRGDDSRKVMDLLMRLQTEAEAAGGAVHVLLGNHEAMNLLGDLRYVTPGEFASYAAEEPAGLRERVRGEWLARRGPNSGGEFDQRFPPGWFGHRAAFAPSGAYGRWLLALPVAIVVNDTLFMHGGPSRMLAGMSLPEISLRYRTALTDYLGALAPIETAGLVQSDDAFADRADAARRRLAAQPPGDASAAPGLADALERFVAADRNPMLGLEGPNWYRGAALCNECAEADVLRPILDGLHVARVVIGHTVAHDGRVASRFDGAVVKLDSGMNVKAYGGHPAALVLEGGEARVLYAGEGGKASGIPAEPLYVTPPALDDAQVVALLASGGVTVAAPRASGVDVTVTGQGHSASAVFVVAKGDVAKRELAAYRLDRLLRLGLVPATVEREVDGSRGYLQARPARWVTQADVQEQKLAGGGWCAFEPQFQLVAAFDALIGNEARTPERLLFDAEEWNVLLTGHERAFGTGADLPDYLKARPPAPGAELRSRLSALDATSLAQAVGELLGARERSAILERRDRVLAGATAATPPEERRQP